MTLKLFEKLGVAVTKKRLLLSDESHSEKRVKDGSKKVRVALSDCVEMLGYDFRQRARRTEGKGKTRRENDAADRHY